MSAPAVATPVRTLPALALVFNALVWGLSWIGFKALHQHGLHPLWATALIYGAALVLLAGLRPAGWRELRGHPCLLLLAVSCGLTNVGFNWGATIGDPMRVVLLFYLMPLWSIGLAWWLLKERPTAAALMRLALALGGVVLVLGQPATGGGGPAAPSLADALALMAGLSFALTNTLLRRWRAVPAQARALAMFGGGFVMPLVLAPLVAGSLHAVASWQAVPWAVVLCLGMLAGNLALQYGAARLPAQVAALIMLSEVVVASVSAVWLGAADPKPATLAGGVLIVLAALLAVLRGRR